jgi:hypothetical protein
MLVKSKDYYGAEIYYHDRYDYTCCSICVALRVFKRPALIQNFTSFSTLGTMCLNSGIQIGD